MEQLLEAPLREAQPIEVLAAQVLEYRREGRARRAAPLEPQRRGVQVLQQHEVVGAGAVLDARVHVAQVRIAFIQRRQRRCDVEVEPQCGRQGLAHGEIHQRIAERRPVVDPQYALCLRRGTCHAATGLAGEPQQQLALQRLAQQRGALASRHALVLLAQGIAHRRIEGQAVNRVAAKAERHGSMGPQHRAHGVGDGVRRQVVDRRRR